MSRRRKATPDIGQYRGYIEAALQYTNGDYTYEDVAAGVKVGHYQFWPGPSSVVITEIAELSKTRNLIVFLAGGNLAEIEKMHPSIERWGRTQGCAKMVFAGRRGWERTFLTRTGFKPTLVVFEKDLQAHDDSGVR